MFSGTGNEIRTHDFNLGKVISLPGRMALSAIFLKLQSISAEQEALESERRELLRELSSLLAELSPDQEHSV